MKGFLFPYEILNCDLKLEIANAFLITKTNNILNEVELNEAIDTQFKYVNLWQENGEPWFLVKLGVTIEGDRGDLEPFYQSSENLSLTVEAKCRFSHFRKSFLLKKTSTNPYLWQGEVAIDRREVFGLVKIKGFISAKALGRNNRFIAETNEWTIYLNKAYMPHISGAIPIRWIDFASDSTYGNLRTYSTEPYYLNLSLPIPELYLNKGFIGLPQLFPDNYRPSGSQLAVHETFRTAVAKSVWLSLFHASLDGIVFEEGEEPSLPIEDWKVSVLQQILPKLYPGFSFENAFRKIVQEKVSGDMNMIESGASAVIGHEIVRIGKALRTAIQNIDNIIEERA